MISTEVATTFISRLVAIPFFPDSQSAQAAVGQALRDMCVSNDDALWLVDRMIELYDRWPGIPETRRVLCSGRRPRDGKEPVTKSEFFPDGIPSERPESEPMREMRAVGGAVSAIPELAEAVRDLAEKTNLNAVGRRPRGDASRVIHLAKPNPPANPITQEDVRAAEEKYRSDKQKAEVST